MTAARRTISWIALLGVGLGLAAWAGPADHAAAQRFSRTLEGIRVSVDAGRETILLTFSAPYEGNPIEEHSAGSFRLRFSATGSNLSRNLFQIRDTGTLIQDYKVVQSQYASTVVVNLRDPQLNLEGQLSVARNGNALQIALNAPAAARAGAEDTVLSEARDRIGGGATEGAAPPAQTRLGNPETPLGGAEDNWLETLATMVVALIFVLLVLYGMVFAYNKFLSGKIGPRSGNLPIRQLGAYAIGPRQRIVVLDINGEIVACGVTPQQINYLTHLGRSRTQRSEPESGSSEAVTPPAGAQSSGSGEKDPVHQFAENLREKVRSLKRIK